MEFNPLDLLDRDDTTLFALSEVDRLGEPLDILLYLLYVLPKEQAAMSSGFPSPQVVDLGNDLAAGDGALHELKVYTEGDKVFAHLKLELNPEKAAGHALNPIEGLYPDGHPQYGKPSHVRIPSPGVPRLLEAVSVPMLPAPVVEEAPKSKKSK